MLKTTLTAIAVLVFPLAHSDNTLNYVEYPISKNNLIAITSDTITVRLCDKCQITRFKSSSDISYREYREDIDFKRAVELSIKKPHEKIFLFLDQSNKIVDAVIFGDPNDASDIKD